MGWKMDTSMVGWKAVSMEVMWDHKLDVELDLMKAYDLV